MVYLLNMVIFYSYVKLPGGNGLYKVVPPFENAKLVKITPRFMVFVGDISIVNGLISPI